MKSVLRSELELISVPEREVSRLRGIASDFIKSLKREGLRAFVGGSLAKGTMVVKKVQDIDVFVVFDYSEDILKLEKILKEIDLPGELKKVHGSRDYFHVVMDDLVLEIVPVVKNSDPELAENVTDLSLSHVEYVVGAIKENPELAGEIMLAKAFCRAQRCYGAEGYVRGFSGYSLEILIIFYGSFSNFLKKIIAGRRPKAEGRKVGGSGRKIVLDPHRYFKNKAEVLREINSSKLQGPVVVVDPTYKYRNVCAGLGSETFERFLGVASDFLKRPSLDFFVKKGIDVKALRALAGGRRQAAGGGVRFLELELRTDRQEGDIAGTKMRKIFRFFERELRRQGQEVLRREFDYLGVGQEARGYLVVKENLEVEVRGPSVGLQECVAEFKKAKRDAVFERKGFWWWRKKVSVEGVLEFVRKVEGEMGAQISLCEI